MTASSYIRFAFPFIIFCLAGTGVRAEKIEFNRDIRPILADKCFACHGPDKNKRKAKLRLDVEDTVFTKREEGNFILKPGDLKQSDLWYRVTTTDEDDHMPPAKTNKTLSPQELNLIKSWIEQGAKYQGHWAFIPPQKPAVPKIDTRHPVVNPIDTFILQKLNAMGLAPSPQADRITLARRLYFDLLGLPPTPDAVQAFVNSKDPKAYEKLIDRLLASEHFGERMAIYWLDVVRFADSNGYHSDEARSVGPYREYVIDAFNQNKKFDRFLIEQLAGDLLPEASIEQKVASGFNMLLQTTNEGGAQPKEYLAKYAADRVRNTGTIFMGLTLGCAECHTHKFDPITDEDFYNMQAFFADIKEAGKGNPPTYPVPSLRNKEKVKQLEAQILALQQEAKTKAAAYQYVDRKPKNFNPKPQIREVVWVDDGTPAGAQRTGAWKFGTTKDKHPVFSGEHSHVFTAKGLDQHFFLGASDTLNLSKGDKLFTYVYLDPLNPPKQIMLQWNKNGQWEHRAYWGGNHIQWGKDGQPSRRNMGALPPVGEWVKLEVDAAHVGLPAGSKINGWAFSQFDGTVYWDKAGSFTDSTPDISNISLAIWAERNKGNQSLPQPVKATLQNPPETRSTEETKALTAYYVEHVYADTRKLFEANHNQIKNLNHQKDNLKKGSLKTLMTVSTKPRMIRLLPRGNWMDDSGPEMKPAIPKFFGELAVKDRRANRLDLAEWMVDKNNPLTARTFVNRLWKLFFGQGISSRLDDLGSQGQWPTHPQLLDWLAVEFMDSGWDVKHMIKTMLLSATYQQQSIDNDKLRFADPSNKYYARQSRWRLDAELVRDNALAVSGLLVKEIGGASVKPYQPAGYWKHMNFPKRKWTHDKGSNQYRRGLYTWWQRMFLHPSMLAFDAPSREESCVERSRSNTPQQALALLNDPTYVESARVFAQRMIKEGGAKPTERINWAYQHALSRKVTPDELKVYAEVFRNHNEQYKKDKASAESFIRVGDTPADASIDPIELASWSSVSRIILNLHETITRR